MGRVYDFALNDNNQGVTIDVLIERRFTNLVKKGSRFWNVSGVKADVGLGGAKVQLESLSALVNGAIAFDSPADSQPAQQNDEYGLYEDLAHSQRGSWSRWNCLTARPESRLHPRSCIRGWKSGS
ncbi:paraquat-inducible protein B [Raoultella planticola]|uniref:Paraquat-inducible protein B n=1 Tax=Raoultella planticola TaxID=575 RepID=A0A485AUG8_RAOPL|nr:paraquat-inducible protein B [Raoultella planticola]